MDGPSSCARRIVFATFESEFAPVGGLGAVMSALPKAIADIEPCFTIAPFFSEITPRLRPQLFREFRSIGAEFEVTFGHETHPVKILEHRAANGFATYLLDTPAFFNAPCGNRKRPTPTAPCNPYFTPSNPGQLLQDALFFCAAVPVALNHLGVRSNIILCLQDWETACISLTIKETNDFSSTACLLVLHNFYDSPIAEDDFLKITKRELHGPTVLSNTIPLMDGPICAVSKRFATELISDPLHTAIYTPHLQALFKEKGVIGINNGLFQEISFAEDAIEAAQEGDFIPIQLEKNRHRQQMRDVLSGINPSGRWGRLDFSNFDGPVLVFSGRDDPCQKGFDLAAAAIRNMPEGRAKYILLPIPGFEGEEGLEFLRQLASDRPGEVIILPFRMETEYREILSGSSFLCMCSFYEPFGSANEGYAVGTPVIARATGGLIQQVNPHPSSALSEDIVSIVRQYHPNPQTTSGFLFRESTSHPPTIEADWRAIVERSYWPDGNRLTERLKIPLFQVMTEAAVRTFLMASVLYDEDPVKYAEMIFNGTQLLGKFSWRDSAQEYLQFFDLVCE